MTATQMQITATLPATLYTPAALWASDDTHRARAVNYCGCADVTVWRNDRELYSQCCAHGTQPIGLCVRIRINHAYAVERRGWYSKRSLQDDIDAYGRGDGLAGNEPEDCRAGGFG
jgi:hypothetical protein